MNMKRHNFNILLVIIAVLLTASCQNTKKDQSSETSTESTGTSKDLHDQVMQIHDEIMPKMDNIMKAKGQLQEKLDSLRASNGSEEVISELEKAKLALSEADEAMMQWMRDFKPQEDGADEKAIMDYYKDQEEKIKAVKDQMYSSLEEAKKLLEGQ